MGQTEFRLPSIDPLESQTLVHRYRRANAASKPIISVAPSVVIDSTASGSVTPGTFLQQGFNKDIAGLFAIAVWSRPVHSHSVTLLFLCFGQGPKLRIRQIDLYSRDALYFVGANVYDLRA